ncbi:hypothetical protein VWX35_16425, partial [Phaeobacter sp. A36a-5a]|uniref:hypothetical protein n=1 Tax=Phaeobacter bryozoorum TaxID=1086632 RepID=UPI003A8919AA
TKIQTQTAHRTPPNAGTVALGSSAVKASRKRKNKTEKQSGPKKTTAFQVSWVGCFRQRYPEQSVL